MPVQEYGTAVINIPINLLCRSKTLFPSHEGKNVVDYKSR